MEVSRLAFSVSGLKILVSILVLCSKGLGLARSNLSRPPRPQIFQMFWLKNESFCSLERTTNSWTLKKRNLREIPQLVSMQYSNTIFTLSYAALYCVIIHSYYFTNWTPDSSGEDLISKYTPCQPYVCQPESVMDNKGTTCNRVVMIFMCKCACRFLM